MRRLYGNFVDPDPAPFQYSITQPDESYKSQEQLVFEYMMELQEAWREEESEEELARHNEMEEEWGYDATGGYLPVSVIARLESGPVATAIPIVLPSLHHHANASTSSFILRKHALARISASFMLRLKKAFGSFTKIMATPPLTIDGDDLASSVKEDPSRYLL